MDKALLELEALQQALDRSRSGQASVQQLCAAAQAAGGLRAALPERFGAVLDDLLNRMEAGALFSEESCSFSQGDLLDSLQIWLDKARERLAQTP